MALDLLPPRPTLWDPARGCDGPEAWTVRRQALAARVEHWVTGAVPPAPPAGSVTADARAFEVAGVRVGWTLGGALRGSGPVVVTQRCHAWWAQLAVRRGLGAVVVDACDAADPTDRLRAACVGFDGGRLAWRAWALARAVDGLEALGVGCAGRLVLAGHSRNAKTALLAMGLDERFAAAALSSSGVLGAVPARLCTDRHGGEGLDLLTAVYPDWFAGRLRDFAGREHLLPTDAHELLALAAPRPVLVAGAVNDQVDSTWACERAVDAARPAWAAAGGSPDALCLRWREGGHEATAAHVEALLDWACDAVAGRPTPSDAVVHPDAWVAHPAPEPLAARPRPSSLSTGDVARPACAASLRGPVVALAPPVAGRGERDHHAALLGRAEVPVGLRRERTTSAEGVDVTVWRPVVDRPAPLVLWLAPRCRPTGHVLGYEQAEPLHLGLAHDGWAVACHDPVGAGARVREERRLAERGETPLERMVLDARHVLAAARALTGGDSAWLAGYGEGALAALAVAALEPAVAGVAVVAPFTGTPLVAPVPQPTLRDRLAVLAPRPVLLVEPSGDPEADATTVLAHGGAAGAHVEAVGIADHHRLSAATRELVRAWLAARAGFAHEADASPLRPVG